MSSDTTTPAASVPAEVDDFEDLLTSQSPTPPRSGPRRGVAALLAVSMLAVLVLGLAWALSRPAPVGDANSDTAAAAAPAVAPEADAPQAQAEAAASGPSSRDWPVPASPTNGPRNWTPTGASGFAHTSAGAAWAAANIAARLDPYAGSRIYRPAFRTQTIGTTDQLLHASDVQYAAAAAKTHTAGGRPISAAAAPPATITSWRADQCHQTCTVHLLSVASDGQQWQHDVPMAWRGGDWVIRLTSASQLFPTAPVSNPAGFRPFQ